MIELALLAFIGCGIAILGLWALFSKAERLPHGGMEFWMAQAMEKDLEAQRLRVELHMQTEIAAKARHALRQYSKLCSERHVQKP